MVGRIFSFLKNLYSNNFPTPLEMARIVRSFNIKERSSFYALIFIFLICLVVGIHYLNNNYMVEVPAYGGTYTEGIIGVPHFINPLLANSDADKDLVELVYSGLLRAGTGSVYIPDLAESYKISDDGRIYTFTLRKGIKFHDGEPVTSEDVAFTIRLVQDRSINSPKLANWEGVSVETPDENTVTFILKKPYAPFLENTTMGILPKHIWQGVNAEEFGYSSHNIEPIGSGPYKILNIENDRTGIPSSYTLRSFNNYALGEPFIKNIVLKFFSTEEKMVKAFQSGTLDAVAALSPDSLENINPKTNRIEETPLPRVFGLFFNQNQATILVDQDIRSALELSIDPKKIIDQALGGHGVPLKGPLPPNTIDSSLEKASEDVIKMTPEARLAAARQLLVDKGWKYNEGTKLLEKTVKKQATNISLTISTINAPELRKATEIIAETWKMLGISVTVNYYEYGDLTQNVIRPRKFDVLFFGTIIGRFPDPYAFWHSKERSDPGLNIAQYANIKADNALEEARKTIDRAERRKLYDIFEKEVASDIPAVFIYSPSLNYVVPKKLGGLSLSGLSTPSERFLSVVNWYIETDSVWKLFAHTNN